MTKESRNPRASVHTRHMLFVCALFKLAGIFTKSWQKTTVVGTGGGGEKKEKNGRRKKGRAERDFQGGERRH